MKLSNDELKKIYFGAYSFKDVEDGYLQAFQYNDDQVAYFKKTSDFWYDRCIASTAKTFEFKTSAKKVSYGYKILWTGSNDTFELCENGRITQIEYVEKIEKEGVITFNLENDGEKDVIIYLPIDATVLVRDFEIDADFTPAKKGEKVLWLGDSITQGFGPLRSAHTYVSVANRLLNYDIINQGIGGYVYDKNVLVPMPGYTPDKIIVAMGTNQYGTETMKDIEEYYERITELYKGIPILCVTPLWRGDNMEGVPTLIKFCDKLKAIVAKYPIVKMVDGFELVPHLPEYFLDNLHPNAHGCEIYGRNLVLKIQELGF